MDAPMNEIKVDGLIKQPPKSPEKTVQSPSVRAESPHRVHDDFQLPRWGEAIWKYLGSAGIELRGLEPIPAEKRTNTQYTNVFTIFAASMLGIVPISIGSVATLGFGLPFRHAAIMIILVQLLFGLVPAYVITIGPLTGMRQMVQSRYCFGKYCNILTSLVVSITLAGFGITGAITGSQALAIIRPGYLSVDAGIVIILLLSLVISFMGYRVLHAMNRWLWIPISVAVILLVVASAGPLQHQTKTPGNTSLKSYMSLVALCAGNMISWANVAGDFSCYMPPDAPRLRLAVYTILGCAVPSSLMMVFGAAIGASVHGNHSWQDAYQAFGIGGVIGAMITDRFGDFGRFILLILGLGAVTTCSREMYSLTFTIPLLALFLQRVPRIILAVASTGVMIGLAIAAARSFVASLTTFLSVIGYYSGGSVTCYLLEYIWFCQANASRLDADIWDDGKKLPSGFSALVAMCFSWGLIIPSMDQAWYTGPIAQVTGDLGFIVAVAGTAVIYLPIRTLELKFQRGRERREDTGV